MSYQLPLSVRKSNDIRGISNKFLFTKFIRFGMMRTDKMGVMERIAKRMVWWYEMSTGEGWKRKGQGDC